MSKNELVYSIQQTYIIKPVSKSENRILSCDERIYIPTIEPLPGVKPVYYDGKPLTIIPCIELAGEFLSEFSLTFETNEGVTVLPVEIYKGHLGNINNPYTHFRYVLALPHGATGIKSCKLIHKATGKEVQHNLTFGVMHPPYNYDNALFGYLIVKSRKNENMINDLLLYVQAVTIKKKPVRTIESPKNEARLNIDIAGGESFFYVKFDYPLSSEPTIHKPRIILHSDGPELTYDLSLNKTSNIVSIDLLAGTITVYDGDNMEIIQQFMIDYRCNVFSELVFNNFNDISSPTLTVISKGCSLGV